MLHFLKGTLKQFWNINLMVVITSIIRGMPGNIDQVLIQTDIFLPYASTEK